jgi:hypothetical protein
MICHAQRLEARALNPLRDIRPHTRDRRSLHRKGHIRSHSIIIAR